jgi:hypothetical protein
METFDGERTAAARHGWWPGRGIHQRRETRADNAVESGGDCSWSQKAFFFQKTSDVT